MRQKQFEKTAGPSRIRYSKMCADSKWMEGGVQLTLSKVDCHRSSFNLPPEPFIHASTGITGIMIPFVFLSRQ